MSLEQEASEVRGRMERGRNPADAVSAGGTIEERRRTPMSQPQQKLKVPEIPGYHLYWMKGTPERIQQARAAGYEFVTPEEINVNNFDVAGDAAKDGNSDLGSRVSILASSSSGGETGSDGQPLRLYLMKQKMEWYLEDKRILENRNASIADALTGSLQEGTVGGRAAGETGADVGLRYVDRTRTKIPDLFKPKPSRRAS